MAFDSAPTIAEERGTRNPLLSVFPSLDLIAVIEVVLSLLVIFLAYDSISGERERGTLRLVLSNTLPRHTLLLGNLVGGMMSVLFPLLVGVVISLIIMHLDSMIVFSAHDYLRILVILVMAVLYLSVFYTIGMFLSSRIRRSATVLVLLLFIWIVSVIIIPNTAVYAAQQFVTVPDRAVVDSRAEGLVEEWAEKMFEYASDHPNPRNAIMTSLLNEFTKDDITYIQRLERGRSVYTGRWPVAFSYYYGPKEMVEWYYDGSVYGHTLRMEYEDRIWQLYQDYQRNLNRQAGAARLISMFSPSWLFSHGSSVIAGTGENDYLRFLEHAANYRQQIIAYMKDNNGFDHLLFTRKPVDSFLSARELLSLRNSRGEEAVTEIMNYSIDPLDLSDLPHFDYSIAGFGDSIANSLFELLILVFLNILFFSLGWISFLRADVR